MFPDRLSLALSDGDLTLPAQGRIALFAPRVALDASLLPPDRVQVITTFKPDHDAFEAAGFACARAAEGAFAMAIICLPRSKAQGRALLAAASAVVDPGGLIVVDGQKTDGIESMLRDLRALDIRPMVLSKAHGKMLWFNAAAMPAEWHAQGPRPIAGGFVTSEGVFSADAIDPASKLLADSLPDKIGAHIADLGAGWGYLSARILTRDTVRTLDLVEADDTALRCVKLNVTDPRARFHWADATRWKPQAALDAVVMNPPFHTGRAAEPDIGRAFIAAAAAMLTAQGRLWMVANRHLPYEATLSELFKDVTELTGDNRFKILMAARPSRQRR